MPLQYSSLRFAGWHCAVALSSSTHDRVMLDTVLRPCRPSSARRLVDNHSVAPGITLHLSDCQQLQAPAVQSSNLHLAGRSRTPLHAISSLHVKVNGASMPLQSSDRRLVGERMKAHVASPDTTPLLIFPEGTCVNNEYCVMFKRLAPVSQEYAAPGALACNTSCASSC